MCGFAGFISKKELPNNSIGILNDMGLAIKNRGPDSSGVWQNIENKVGFSHRRLSILDLTSAGHQPMTSKSSRFVIAYNGEIYNHLELRTELINAFTNETWEGHSDTETLLACFEFWGIEETIKKAIGMFAFSVWDHEKKTLTLCRDRFGEKPLYYGWQNDTFLFGSELKALKQHPEFKNNINRDAVTLLLRHNCIPSPHCIYEGIHKLLPGTILEMDTIGNELSFSEYWSAKHISENANSDRFTGTPEQAIDELEKILKKSIKEQMISDVPLGAFLSGGVDSSTVVALMQSQSSTPIKTFSIGFYEEGYNEAKHAKVVAKHLGTDHTELYVTSEKAMGVIYDLVDMFDEPFSDSSQIPTFIVSKLAKQQVTVCLSGDGGDELFCGYNRYVMTDRVWRRASKLPIFIRLLLQKIILTFSVDGWNKFYNILPIKKNISNFGDKLHKAATVLSAESVSELYKKLVSHWQNPKDVVLDSKEPLTALTDFSRRPSLNNSIEQMMILDTISYLSDDILTKVDRTAMANSLEGRVPFLNHRVFEFAWSLPLNYKLRNGEPKWCLKELLYRYVPKPLIDRPKMGFGIPIDSWLRGPLKSWAESLLNSNRLKKEGIFEVEQIRNMWDEHQSGKRNWQYHLWDILMFQAWYEKNQ